MITLRPSVSQELDLFASFEAEDDVCDFITPYSRSEHAACFDDEAMLYLSIVQEDRVVGFFILRFEGDAVEFRRVVVTTSARGIGRKAIRVMHDFCAMELGVTRVWLDVFEHNERARHVYTSLGYRVFDRRELDGKQLLLMEKHIQQADPADGLTAATDL